MFQRKKDLVIVYFREVGHSLVNCPGRMTPRIPPAMKERNWEVFLWKQKQEFIIVQEEMRASFFFSDQEVRVRRPACVPYQSFFTYVRTVPARPRATR